MTGRRAIIGLCMSCALLVSAVAASGAQAAATAYTCSSTAAVKDFAGAHCAANGAGSAFGHEAFGNVETTLSGGPGTEFSGVQRLRATINGINTELVTEGGVSGSGTLTTNNGTEVAGTGTITYTNVTVAAPAGKGCKVYTDNGGSKGEEGVVHTNNLAASTTSPGELKFTPGAGAGGVFATFIIDGCTGSEALEGLNKTYEVTGSLIGTPKGGETVATHTSVTTQNTLKLNGSIKAGLNGSLTIKGANGNALALT
jgi:hypothetical protein